METPQCAGTYEPGNDDCDGGCDWRDQCIALKKLCRERGWKVEWLTEKLSSEDLTDLASGDLEIEVERGGSRKTKIKRVRKKHMTREPRKFPEATWEVHRHFENQLMDAFGSWRVRRLSNPRMSGRVIALIGTIYPIDDTQIHSRVLWGVASPRLKRNEKLAVVYLKMNKPLLNIFLPVTLEELRESLSASNFAVLRARENKSPKALQSAIMDADRECAGIAVAALRKLASMGRLPILSYKEWNSRYRGL